MRKTKIVCTLGPASASSKIIRELILAGMNVARLNFSHGQHKEHLLVLKNVREVSRSLNKPVGIIQDLCGPKIRVGKIKGDKITLKKGRVITLTCRDVPGDERQLHVSCPGFENDVKKGESILIDDGLIELKIEEVSRDSVICKIITGGILSSHKGVNFPQSNLKLPSLTRKDLKDLEFGLKNKVDFIALSFVRVPEDVLKLKDIITERKADIPVISKIEKAEAVKNIKEIIQVTDCIMVARGDLGVEVQMEDVPLIQKDIIKRCNKLSKPVITATQMLDSMIRNPRPTRAEATDVANAVLDGTDAVMLSGETASGSYPVQAVKVMSKIAENTEKAFPYERVLTQKVFTQNVVEVISLATCEIAEELKAKAILTFTSSGRTAKRISKYKPRVPVLAAVDDKKTERELSLSWGVFPFVLPQAKTTDKMIKDATSIAKKIGLLKNMDMVIITAGIPAGISGSTNMIKVDIVGHIFLRGHGAGRKSIVTGKLCIASSPDEAHKKAEPCDILLVPDLKGNYDVVLKKIRGVVTALSHCGSKDEEILEKYNIPGILGVPNAFKVFSSGRIVTLDAFRGIIYEA